MQAFVIRCLIAMTRQNYWEDVCGLATKRSKEFQKRSVQQQCLRCSHWRFAASWGIGRSSDKQARGAWKRKQDPGHDWAMLQGPSRHPAAGNSACFRICRVLCLLVWSYCNSVTLVGSFILHTGTFLYLTERYWGKAVLTRTLTSLRRWALTLNLGQTFAFCQALPSLPRKVVVRA